MTRSAVWHFAGILVAALFAAALALAHPAIAQSSPHLVSPSDLQQATIDASRSRQQNIDTLKDFLSTDQAQKAMQSAHIDPQQVTNAVSGLSDEELSQLASRAGKAQSDFAAGSMDNRDLLIIVLCIVALILIIVAVH